jgi:hypothetical protein
VRFRPWTGAPSAKHFEQCAEFALLRNCSLRALAGMVLAIPLARRPVTLCARTAIDGDIVSIAADVAARVRQAGDQAECYRIDLQGRLRSVFGFRQPQILSREHMACEISNSEMSSQIIPLKARADPPDPSRIPAMETTRV